VLAYLSSLRLLPVATHYRSTNLQSYMHVCVKSLHTEGVIGS